MKITRFKTTLVDVPLKNPITTAIHQIRSIGCVLLELETGGAQRVISGDVSVRQVG